jgi:PAS domain S-box-containing protein
MEAENQTATKSELLAQTLRSIGDGIVTTDLEANVTFINRTAELLIGCDAAKALGAKSWEIFRLVDHNGKERRQCPVQVVLESGEATGYRNHTCIVQSDGGLRPVSYSAAPLRAPDGEMQGVVLAFHCVKDIVKSSADRISLIARATNDAVWDWDLVTGQFWWNDAVGSLFGYQPEDIEPRVEWFLDKVHPEDRARIQDRIFGPGELRQWQDEFRFRSSDETYQVIFERGYVLRDPLGNPVRMLGTMMDVTARRSAQDELLRLNADLELTVQERTSELREANRQLESFSYSVSHDLRSPLRSIMALSRILKDENLDRLDSESRENLGRLVVNAERMAKLIDDLLQYSRLSRSKLHIKRFSLSDIASSVAEDMCSRPGCRAQISVEPDMVAECDPDLIRILFENLIGNAVKYSSRVEQPLVEVGQTEFHGQTTYFVRDNGAGFDPKYSSKLFVPFERLHDSEDFEGTGIGLANVHRIVQRHGGRVWATGEVGKGATFYFTL